MKNDDMKLERLRYWLFTTICLLIIEFFAPYIDSTFISAILEDYSSTIFLNVLHALYIYSFVRFFASVLSMMRK